MLHSSGSGIHGVHLLSFTLTLFFTGLAITHKHFISILTLITIYHLPTSGYPFYVIVHLRILRYLISVLDILPEHVGRGVAIKFRLGGRFPTRGSVESNHALLNSDLFSDFVHFIIEIFENLTNLANILTFFFAKKGDFRGYIPQNFEPGMHPPSPSPVATPIHVGTTKVYVL